MQISTIGIDIGRTVFTSLDLMRAVGSLLGDCARARN